MDAILKYVTKYRAVSFITALLQQPSIYVSANFRRLAFGEESGHLRTACMSYVWINLAPSEGTQIPANVSTLAVLSAEPR